jgi:hypothetical protein
MTTYDEDVLQKYADDPHQQAKWIRVVRDLSFQQRTAFWLVALVSGLLQSLASRFDIGADSLSYLEIGQTYFRGDWKTAINSYWSPLYSWLIALPLRVFSISPYWESTCINLVNLAIYVFALFSLEFLLSNFIQSLLRSSKANGEAPVPAWAFRLIGYTLFLYSSVAWLGAGYSSPDLLVAAVVMLDVGVIIRIYVDGPTFANYAFLGLFLGIGYLAKVVLLPLGLVFLLMSLFAGGISSRTVIRFSLGLVMFGLVAAPFIYALSVSKNRFCYGDSGKHNYTRYIDGVSFSNYYQRADKRAGSPLRSIKKLLDDPPTYEIGQPFRASYAPWYDPTYWWEGIVPYWSLRAEISAFHQHLHFWYEVVTGQAEFVAGLLTLLLLSRKYLTAAKRLWAEFFIWLPSVVACIGYSLIHVEVRFLPGFLIVLWLSLFRSVPVPRKNIYPRMVRCVVIAMAIVVGIRSVRTGVVNLGRALHARHTSWEVAEQLHRIGVRPRDPVAAIGFNVEAYWAHLAGVSIVAELTEVGAGTYWVSSSEVRSNVLRVFAQVGAKAVVCNRTPEYGVPSDWLRVGQSGFFIRGIPDDSLPPAPPPTKNLPRKSPLSP